MRTPLSRVLHLGAAGGGAEHFWRVRVTAAANIVLVSAFVIVMLATVGRPHGEVAAILGSPLVASLLVLLILSVAVHMRLGIQVAIEDYVTSEALKVVLLIASTFFAAAIAVVGILSVLTLAFAG